MVQMEVILISKIIQMLNLMEMDHMDCLHPLYSLMILM